MCTCNICARRSLCYSYTRPEAQAPTHTFTCMTAHTNHHTSSNKSLVNDNLWKAPSHTTSHHKVTSTNRAQRLSQMNQCYLLSRPGTPRLEYVRRATTISNDSLTGHTDAVYRWGSLNTLAVTTGWKWSKYVDSTLSCNVTSRNLHA